MTESKFNSHLLQIRPNEWINGNEYRNCTLIQVSNEEYKLLLGTLNQFTAWVQIEKDNLSWVYYPVGNKSFPSQPYAWLGDLLDDAVDNMLRAKL